MSETKERVYLFDFDGTLTSRDTLIAFLRFACGTGRFVMGMLLFSPLLVLMKLGLYPNYKAKQRLFAWFFGGMEADRFDGLCRRFARSGRPLLREKAVGYVHNVLSKDPSARVFVVSASIDNWVAPFCRYWFEDAVPSCPTSGNATPGDGRSRDDGRNEPRITVLGTRIEVAGGRVTGRFASPNCYGAEKVRRVEAVLGDRDSCFIEAFGDSRGDKELLAYADKGHFRPFE